YAAAERPREAVEGEVLGPRKRNGHAVSDGPAQRGRLRKVRSGSGQTHEMDGSRHSVDRRRRVEFLPWRGLDWLEPDRFAISERSHRLHLSAYVCWQSHERLLRILVDRHGSGRTDPDYAGADRGRVRRSAPGS